MSVGVKEEIVHNVLALTTNMEYLIGIILSLLAFCQQCSTVPKGCDGNVDLTFLVDSSNSMLDLSPFEDSMMGWRSHQAFMKQIVTELPVGFQTKVALVTYANSARLDFHMYQHSTPINVIDAILSASFMGGNTNSAAALRLARDTEQLQTRSGYRKAVVMFTDGLTNLEVNNTRAEAELLHRQGTEIFVVAVSHEINMELLEFIASKPSNKYVINVGGVEDLNAELAMILTHRICDVGDPVMTEPTPSCLPGCAKCQDEEVCMECEVGFYKKNDKCLACMENCGVCEGNNNCKVCKSGWYWEPSTSTCEACEVRADIGIVVDSSQSIRAANPEDGSYDNYQILKDFLKGIVTRLDVSADAVRVGLVMYSDEARVIYHLDQYLNSEQMSDSIQNMPYIGRQTNTAAGLRFLRRLLFMEGRGDRPDVRNVGLVITDGASTVDRESTLGEGQLAKDEGIALFVVGATDNINIDELKAIASDPDEDHFFESPEIRNLDTIMDSLIKHVCKPTNN